MIVATIALAVVIYLGVAFVWLAYFPQHTSEFGDEPFYWPVFFLFGLMVAPFVGVYYLAKYVRQRRGVESPADKCEEPPFGGH